jgi:formate dehydrogenase subunit gamma
MPQAWDPTIAADLIGRHQHRAGALLPILHDIQHAFGHVPAEAVPQIAEALNISRADVHGVITFYHDFRTEPHGRHVLKLCRAEACQARGADAVVKHAEQRLGVELGETTPDGRFTVEPTFCLGLCASGPAALINDRVVGKLDNKKVDALLLEAR